MHVNHFAPLHAAIDHAHGDPDGHQHGHHHGHHHGQHHAQHHGLRSARSHDHHGHAPRSARSHDHHGHAEHPDSPGTAEHTVSDDEEHGPLFGKFLSMGKQRFKTRGTACWSYQEEVDTFMPFAEHILQTARFEGTEIKRKELTDEEIADIGRENDLAVAEVRQAWECFKACDRKGLGYLDADEMKLLLALLDHIDFKKASRALQDHAWGLRFPTFVAVFHQACRGPSMFSFRMEAVRQEVNNVYDMIQQAEMRNAMTKKSNTPYNILSSSMSTGTCRFELHRYDLDHVPEVHVHDYLSREITNTKAYKQLPYALGLFLLFCFAMHLHTLPWKIFTVELSMQNDIYENANFAFSGTLPLENGRMGHKSLKDVNAVQDFWSWLSAGLCPLLWVESWGVSEVWSNTLARCSRLTDLMDGYGWNSSRSDAVKNVAYSKTVPANKTAFGGPAYSAECPAKQTRALPVEFYGLQKHGRGMYLYFNRVIGGLRLRQERRKYRACQSEAYRETSGAFGAPCFDGQLFVRPDQRSLISMRDELVDSSRTTYLRTGESQAQIRQEIKLLEDKRWIDQSVQKIELAFPSLNAEMGTLTVCYIIFHLPMSGHILKSIEPQTVFLRPYHGWWNYVLDSGWAMMALKLLLKEIQLVSSTTRKFGVWQGLWHYASFWNVIDLFSVCMGCAIMGFWIRFLVLLQNMEALLLTGQNAVNGNWETDEELAHFFNRVTSILKYKLLLQRIFALYVVVCVLRFFKAFNAQPRLAVVTRTLAIASADILYFGISFLTVLFTFALSGVMFFGQDLEDFQTVDRACTTCYRLLLGDFDFQSLWEYRSIEASVWFWLNTILLFLIVLNMLLAIIMDVYTEVYEEVGGDLTLFAQAQLLLGRWWRRRKGEDVYFSEVLDALVARREQEVHHDGENPKPPKNISRADLKKLVLGLEDKQALDILEGANLVFERASARDSDLSLSATIVRLEDMLGRQMVSLQSVHHLLESFASIAEDIQVDSPVPVEKRLPDGEQHLNAVLEKISPDEVSAAVEQAFAIRVDPLFEELVKVRNDISTCVGELGKNFEKRFGALERHAEHICRELDQLQNGRPSSQIFPSYMPYASSHSWILEDDRLLDRTPISTPCAHTPADVYQRLLEAHREDNSAPT